MLIILQFPLHRSQRSWTNSVLLASSDQPHEFPQRHLPSLQLPRRSQPIANLRLSRQRTIRNRNIPRYIKRHIHSLELRARS